MNKNRIEAFSDGVLAIIITIMVLELRVPEHASQHAAQLTDLKPLWPVFLSYVLSYVYIGIYWNNHHHLLHATQRSSASIMWTNLHLLFWLSLTPFVTSWMGENRFSPAPTALYGFVLLMAAIAYWLLQRAILASHGEDSLLARALGPDWKGRISPLLYLVAIPCSFISPWIAGGIYVLVALLWLVPDRRIERTLLAESHASED